ncbi:MAG TPA: SAM-dependent methyltransferase [Lautropia sp.]|nr:SAM-dependent methyltransferase [Lautropia sp.]
MRSVAFMMLKAQGEASPWVQRHLQHRLATASEKACLMDWACGAGRHSLLALARGWKVFALDHDEQALASLRESADARAHGGRLHCLRIDLEGQDSMGEVARALSIHGVDQVSAIVVCNYLHRRSWIGMLECLAPGGSLIYETFAQGHEQLGRPRRAAFLLQPGELLAKAQACHLAIMAYEDVVDVNEQGEPVARMQRLYARKPGLASSGHLWLS